MTAPRKPEVSAWTFDEICESQDFAHSQEFVKRSAYEAVCKERDALKVLVEFQEKQARCQPDFKDEYDNLSKFTEDLRKERDALEAQLTRIITDQCEALLARCKELEERKP